MSFVINLPKNVATLVSEGVHKSVITKTIERTSRYGEPLVSCAFETEEGIVWHNVVFALPDEQNTEKKEFMDNRNSQFLSYLGLKFTGKIKIDPGKEWIGKGIGIKVDHEEYEGITRARVRYFLDPKVVDKKDVSNEEVEKIEETVNIREFNMIPNTEEFFHLQNQIIELRKKVNEIELDIMEIIDKKPCPRLRSGMGCENKPDTAQKQDSLNDCILDIARCHKPF